MLLAIYLQKYVFGVKQKTNVKVFNVITRINYYSWNPSTYF